MGGKALKKKKFRSYSFHILINKYFFPSLFAAGLDCCTKKASSHSGNNTHLQYNGVQVLMVEGDLIDAVTDAISKKKNNCSLNIYI